MKTLNIKEFYKELGKLLYAVAMADKKIQKSELKALQEFVLKDLAFLEPTSDSSGMNQAFYTNFEFEECMNKQISVQEAYDSFITFLDNNFMEIDPVLIKKSIQAIEKIAVSFRKINKKERILIDKFKEEIKEMVEIF